MGATHRCLRGAEVIIPHSFPPFFVTFDFSFVSSVNLKKTPPEWAAFFYNEF